MSRIVAAAVFVALIAPAAASSTERGDQPQARYALCMRPFSVAFHGKGIVAAVAAFLCATSAPAQTVTVNYGYSDLKMACREEFTKRDPERNFACLDWEVKFRDLVSRLDAQFAANPLCHGIYFTQPGEENLPEQHWALALYPAPGQDRQSWILFKYGIGMKSDFRGDGLPQEIAREVCAVVGGQGGVIRK
jgi:hypothetical protein